MGNKKLIREDLNRFNNILGYNQPKGVIKEDVNDTTDGYHSEDPAQIDMFTQQAGDNETQIIRQFISDNNLEEKINNYSQNLQDLVNEWPSILYDLEQLQSDIDYDRFEKRGVNMLEELVAAVEGVNAYSRELEDRLYDTNQIIHEITTGEK